MASDLQSKQKRSSITKKPREKGLPAVTSKKGFETLPQFPQICFRSVQKDIQETVSKAQHRATLAIENLRRVVTSGFKTWTLQRNSSVRHVAPFASLSKTLEECDKMIETPLAPQQHVRKLRHIRVFMVMKDDEDPAFHVDKSKSRDGRKVGFCFFNFEDAEQLLRKMKTDEPETYSKAFVQGLPLSFFYEDYVHPKMKMHKDTTYHFVPDYEDVLAAQEVKGSNEPITGCPVFVCDSIKDTDDAVPYFLSYADMEEVMSVSLETAIEKETQLLEDKANECEKRAKKLRQEAQKQKDEKAVELENLANAAQEEGKSSLERIQAIPEEFQSKMVPRVENLERFLRQFDKKQSSSQKDRALVAPKSIAAYPQRNRYAPRKKSNRKEWFELETLQ